MHVNKEWDFQGGFSFDAGLIGACCLLMMISAVWISLLPEEGRLAFYILLFGTCMVLSIRHRKKHGWRWPGVDAGDIRRAVFNIFKLAVAFVFFILFFASQTGSGSYFTIFHMFFLLLFIVSVLGSLNMITLSRQSFIEACSNTTGDTPVQEQSKTSRDHSFKQLFPFFVFWWLLPIPMIISGYIESEDIKDAARLTTFFIAGLPSMYYWTRYQLSFVKILIYWLLAPVWAWLPIGILFIKLGFLD